MQGIIEEINKLEAEDGKTSTLQLLTLPHYEGMRMPLMEQLVEEMKSIPQMVWKDARKEPPDKTFCLLVIDSWNREEDSDSDDEGSDDCVFRALRISMFSRGHWRDASYATEQRVRFTWYIVLEDRCFPREYCCDQECGLVKKIDKSKVK